MDITFFIKLALKVGLSTTYGYGEKNCGDIGKPRPCDKHAITASGMGFNPIAPTAAVFAPTNVKIKPTWVYMRTYVMDNGRKLYGPCAPILVNDKGNPRFIGERGFDLSPGALKVLGIHPRGSWVGRVEICSYNIF